jgi:hypothetical protein
MSGRVSLAPTTIGTTPTACIRFTVLSRIEILHILLEHPYDSQRNKNAGLISPTSSATASREKPGSVQSAPTLPAAACRRRIGCTPGRKGSGRPPAAAAIVARSTPRDGEEAVPRCLASGSSGRTVRQWGWPPPPVGSPPTSHTDIVVQVGFSTGRTLVASGGISPCCCGTWPLT